MAKYIIYHHQETNLVFRVLRSELPKKMHVLPMLWGRFINGSTFCLEICLQERDLKEGVPAFASEDAAFLISQ